MKRTYRFLIICGGICLLLSGCARIAETNTETSGVSWTETGRAASVSIEQGSVAEESKATEQSTASEENEEPVAAAASETLEFVDVHGNPYEMVIDRGVEAAAYLADKFTLSDGYMQYRDDDRYDYRLGIDVSKYQGQIDWEKVKAAGMEFVFIRLGYRGYGEAGKLCLDERFEENYRGAASAGLDIGVYFFAQAISAAEAVEEAEFVLRHLEGKELAMPVVYDPETIEHTIARTDNVTKEQFTENTLSFCQRVEEAGYEPMIYANMLWEAFLLDMGSLGDYLVWYADYEDLPQTPYHFAIWQYTNEGRVDGIHTYVDMNIQLIKKK